jgi:hypothetical protein
MTLKIPVTSEDLVEWLEPLSQEERARLGSTVACQG